MFAVGAALPTPPAIADATPQLDVASSHGCGDAAVFVAGEYLDFTIRLLNTIDQPAVNVQVHITMGNGQKFSLGATLSNAKPAVTFSGMRETFPVPPGSEVGVISVNAVLPGGNTTPVTCTFLTVVDATPLPTITAMPGATFTATMTTSAASATPTVVPTATPTVTVAAVETPPPSPTATSTPAPTRSATNTAVIAPSHTPALTPPGTTPTPSSTVTVTTTASPTATATATASALGATVTPMPTLTPPPVCVGDCDGSGQVTVNELLAMVNIALGNTGVSTCMAGDRNHDQQITINEILAAVNNVLNGCRDEGNLALRATIRGGRR